MKHYKIEVVVADVCGLHSAEDYLSDSTAALLSDLPILIVGEVEVFEVTHFE